MCVGFWSLEHPDFALILCTNRDEFLSRPTAPAHWHSFGPIGTDDHGEGEVLSGRDLSAGGTWAGISRTGRLALLTNITEPVRKYTSSRGDLTAAFLVPQTPGATLQAEIDAFLAVNRDRAYAGFNMLLLSPSRTASPGSGGLAFDGAILTNSGGGGKITSRALSEDERLCGGLSNGLTDPGAPAWPKVEHGRTAFAHDVLDTLPRDATEAEIVERLFALLTWRSDSPPTARSELRNTIQVEPLALRLDGAPMHTSPHPSPPRGAAAPGSSDSQRQDPPAHAREGEEGRRRRWRELYYGTRLSTVLLVRRDGSAAFVERDVWTLDAATGAPARATPAGRDRVFRFQIAL